MKDVASEIGMLPDALDTMLAVIHSIFCTKFRK